MKKKTKSLPRKQPYTALAASLGVARTTLYAWKHEGAPVDKGEGAVLAWALDNAKAESDDMRQAKLAVLTQTERRLKLQNDQRAGLVIDRATVADGIAKGVATMFSELDRVFTSELPPQLEALKAPAIAAKCREAIERLKATLRTEFEKLTK